MSSNFKKKAQSLKKTIQQTSKKSSQSYCHIPCTTYHIGHDRPIEQEKQQKITKQNLCIQQPIIIQKKAASRPGSARKENNRSTSNIQNVRTKTSTLIRKQVEPFVPITVQELQKRIDLQSLNQQSVETKCSNKQIQIKIEKDDKKDKQCLKKLFKKIHKLTDDLAAAQKENIYLKAELQNYKNTSRVCNDHEKYINKLEGDKYKFEMELDMLKKLIKDKDDEIKRLIAHKPKQIIKQIVVEKPVQVIVEVPKNVPGPERIVQKVVEVPKYIQIEKKVPVPQMQPAKEIIKTVEVPTIVEKPVYIDKPIYIDRPYEVERRIQVPIQVPVEVPVEVPVYIDKPIENQELILEIRYLKQELDELMRGNSLLQSQNSELRVMIKKLTANLQILSRHNQQKNRQTQMLIQNSFDYYPISPQCDYSGASYKYSVSSHPHPRII